MRNRSGRSATHGLMLRCKGPFLKLRTECGRKLGDWKLINGMADAHISGTNPTAPRFAPVDPPLGWTCARSSRHCAWIPHGQNTLVPNQASKGFPLLPRVKMASTPESLTAAEPQVPKSRRAHTKSRKGCKTCKQRKIKASRVKRITYFSGRFAPNTLAAYWRRKNGYRSDAVLPGGMLAACLAGCRPHFAQTLLFGQAGHTAPMSKAKPGGLAWSTWTKSATSEYELTAILSVGKKSPSAATVSSAESDATSSSHLFARASPRTCRPQAFIFWISSSCITSARQRTRR